MAAPMSMTSFLTGAVIILSTLWTTSSGEVSEENHIATVDDIAFVIRSQPSSVHAKRAEKSKESIEEQCKQLNQAGCDVVLIHVKYQNLGSWILLPIFPSLADDFPKKKWLFFCEEETEVNVAGLLEVLKKYDSSKGAAIWKEKKLSKSLCGNDLTDKPLFLGKALVDQVPSIIHHYKFHEDVTKFKFPDFEAGWLINRELLQIIARRWKEEPADINFSIDIKHEVAVFIWNEGNGTTLLNVPELCADGSQLPREYKKGKCVTQHHKDITQCGEPVPQEKVLFAVKTCQKFHKSRVKVVLNSWGQFADNVIYYSDIKDDSIPTVDVKIPNVERGHCSKTLEILKLFLEDEKQAKYSWLIIVDDDTILSVSRLMKLLSCYDPTEDIFLGERYGYGHGRMFGYDYVTGGGGMVFSRTAVSSFIKKGLRCGKHDDPDDMIIGMYAKSFSIPVIHSPLFHQSQPQQYALGFLAHQTPVSFHKHTNLDPYEVYNIWFQADDETAARDEQTKFRTSKRDEL